MLQDSEIQYDIHPKIIAEIYNILGFRFERVGKDFESEVTGKDIHKLGEYLLHTATRGVTEGTYATARMAVERYDEKELGGGRGVATFDLYLKVGTSSFEYLVPEELDDSLSKWEQDVLEGWTEL
jgi:hypothetical protein